MPNSNARFQKGSGCYVCECCGKRTRETGKGNSSDAAFIKICVRCFDIGDNENEVLDGYMTEAEFVEIWGQHSECYKIES
jgi:ribosome-binding protein aMBF1 (putative translation factor)